ncbi:MAG: LOG family protein [Planctomycetes bacterium]|nr:LOG family protein [Planctomycetota bacterium]
MDRSYVTPETDDGVVSKVFSQAGARCQIEARIPLKRHFLEMVRGRESEIVFAARSRLARLGIDVVADNGLTFDGDVAVVRASIECVLPRYGIAEFLPDIVVPGLRIGRLVFCPEDRRLSSEQILEQVRKGALQLPARFSIDDAGSFTVQPHRKVYELSRPLTRDDAISIVAAHDGRALLNRLQIPKEVENILLEPGTGVITSCSMFLHRHYVVLDREANRLGRHLQATVLDPVTTRGTRVFLEFTNDSNTTIVNPSVTAHVYDAVATTPQPRVFPVRLPKGLAEEHRPRRTFEIVRELFDRLEDGGERGSYFERLVAVVEDWDAVARGELPTRVWRGPGARQTDIDSLRATRDYSSTERVEFGTKILDELAAGTGATVLLGYFPNLVEHLHLCQAGVDRRIARIVFRRASYEHGPFLSAKDQSRLADYASIGLEVSWCNDAWGHLSTHVFRGLRGYFVEPHKQHRFERALVIAIYGSTRPLSDDEAARLRGLLTGLRRLFGDNLAILTGGGPGAMQQAADIAHELGLLVGANYIETVDQATNKSADFYQCFQDISRHNRQRWFEIASFQIFCTGGLGTLEEIGLTLTDMKLGVIERSPLVFFGSHSGTAYWRDLVRQFETMVADGRAPDWVLHNVLLTDDPKDVPPFYKRVLELG